MEIVSPETIRNNIAKLLNAAKTNQDMHVYIKKELEILVRHAYRGAEDLVPELSKN